MPSKRNFKLVALVSASVLLGSWNMASICLAQGDTWTVKAPVPTARGLCAAAEVDGKIYVIGGATANSYPVHIATVEAYDPATNTWAKKANLPSERGSLSAYALNGKIYAIGGHRQDQTPATNLVEEYDPQTDTWTRKADMPTPRVLLGTCALDGKIYAIGGMYQGQPQSAVEAYDPATDTWSVKAPMPTARNYLISCAINRKIYAIGGAVGFTSNDLPIVEEYDPVTDKWTRKKDMPTSRLGLAGGAVSGLIYAIGGAADLYVPGRKTVEEYNPVTDTWVRKTDMPTPRVFFATSVINGKIYAFGGTTTGLPQGMVATVEEYTPMITSVESRFAGENISHNFVLHQNYPNPFNPTTMIRFLLPKQSHVEIAIYNALGQPIRRLIAKDYPAGTHAVAWDGRDDTNAAMASGIYFYRIQSKDFTAIRKMMLLR